MTSGVDGASLRRYKTTKWGTLGRRGLRCAAFNARVQAGSGRVTDQNANIWALKKRNFLNNGVSNPRVETGVPGFVSLQGSRSWVVTRPIVKRGQVTFV